MAFIGAEELARFLRSQNILIVQEQTLLALYPLRALAVAAVLLLYRKRYTEIRWAELRQSPATVLSLLTGLLIVALWINLDWAPGSGTGPPGFDPNLFSQPAIRAALIGCRLAGAVLVVPVMEELFWRSFLLRYLIKSQFTSVPLGTFTWPSFFISSLLFGFEHHYILAGVVAGILFNLLLYRTRSLSQCIFAHAIANLALGLYVLQTDQWRFW